MVTTEKKQSIIIKELTPKDFNQVKDFYEQNKLNPILPNLFEDISNGIGHSLIATQNSEIIGHLILMPLYSNQNEKHASASLICGIRAINDKTKTQLLKEASMFAWELGNDTLFCFDNTMNAKEAGYNRINENFFSFNTSMYKVYGMELSWNSYSETPTDLYLPQTFLPQIDYSYN